MALRSAQGEPSAAKLVAARATVLNFGRHQDALRKILQESFRKVPNEKLVTQKDKIVVERLREGWTRDIEAQNRNYEQLLEDLTELLANQLKPAPES